MLTFLEKKKRKMKLSVVSCLKKIFSQISSSAAFTTGYIHFSISLVTSCMGFLFTRHVMEKKNSVFSDFVSVANLLWILYLT